MDYSNIPFNRIIADKPRSSYPDYLNDEIKLISINTDNSSIIGSAAYSFIKYPGDYDVFEDFVNTTKENTINVFISGIKKIIRNITERKYHWFLELKVGFDQRFNLNPGKYLNKIFKMSKDFYETATKLFEQHLFSNEEFVLISKIYNMKQAGQLEYELINHLLRKHRVLRWTANEVFYGYKLLPGNLKMFLNDAVSQKGQINIELIAVVNNKITDLSNFFVLISVQNGQKNVLNLSQELITNFNEFFEENLKESIEKLYFSKLDYNPFKVVKRYWSYGRFVKNQALIQKLIPIVSSDISLMYQLKSELGTIIKLLEKTQHYPINIIKEQLSTFKWRLSNIIRIDSELEGEIDNNLNKIINNNLDSKQIIEYLDPIKKSLEEIINENTIQYLKSVGLAPPPSYLLPRNSIFT